jgi:hypothetical protein
MDDGENIKKSNQEILEEFTGFGFQVVILWCYFD